MQMWKCDNVEMPARRSYSGGGGNCRNVDDRTPHFALRTPHSYSLSHLCDLSDSWRTLRPKILANEPFLLKGYLQLFEF